jgi:prepilin-type N-terminal cleavage/methylation domain-containing protein
MTKKRFFRSQAGFTLIEIVVSIGVFTIILVVLFNLYLTYISLYTSQQAKLTAVARARYSLSEITLLTLQAHRVAGNTTVGTTTYYSNTTTIVLQLPAITANGNTINNTWDYVVFYKNGTNLYTITQADAASTRISQTKILTDNLQSLNFTYNNADLTMAEKVLITITTQSRDTHHVASSSLTEELTLRNF